MEKIVDKNWNVKSTDASKAKHRTPTTGRFLGVKVSPKPVTKRASISEAQAEKAVKSYLRSVSK